MPMSWLVTMLMSSLLTMLMFSLLTMQMSWLQTQQMSWLQTSMWLTGSALPRGALWEEQEEPVVLPEEPVVLLEHQEAARQIFFMSEIAESPLW